MCPGEDSDCVNGKEAQDLQLEGRSSWSLTQSDFGIRPCVFAKQDQASESLSLFRITFAGISPLSPLNEFFEQRAARHTVRPMLRAKLFPTYAMQTAVSTVAFRFINLLIRPRCVQLRAKEVPARPQTQTWQITDCFS